MLILDHSVQIGALTRFLFAPSPQLVQRRLSCHRGLGRLCRLVRLAVLFGQRRPKDATVD